MIMDRFLSLQRIPLFFSLLLSSCLTLDALAGVTPIGTRIIIKEGQHEVPLVLSNQNQYPVITQLWVDDGKLSGQPDTAQSPYMVLPPVSKLQEKELLRARLVSTGQVQPTDRESLYWLNIYEVPPIPDIISDNTHRLAIAMRTQMKVIYRPKSLIKSAESAAEKIRFSLEQGQLRLSNPTPHYITISGLMLAHTEGLTIKQVQMLAPFSTEHVELEGISQVDSIDFIWLDDDGIAREHTATLQPY